MSDLNKHVNKDIWLEILKHLPVKTLGQCCCVSKPWNNLIVSPPFVSAHLKTFTENSANSLLMYRQFSGPPEKQEQYTLFLDAPERKDKNNLEVCHTFTSPFMASKVGYHLRVVGSANGLICLSDDLFGYTYVVLVWNPFIHKYIKLPVPGATCYVIVGAYISILGFGYDSKKGDHKVVRLVYIRGDKHLDITPPKVQLYSAQEGKWRWVSADYLGIVCVSDIRWSQCFLNGHIHWISWERDAETLVFERNWLLLFDVEQERFRKRKLPESLSKVNTMKLSISDSDGKLSVLYSELKGGFCGKEMEKCEIWVTKEYNVGSSWCKMVSIELDSSTSLGWVQCFRKNGELLGFTKRRMMVSYNPIEKQVKRIGLRGRWRTWFTYSFTESLILLDKKSGVDSYNEVERHKKKRFSYNINRSTDEQYMEEAEVKIDGEDEEDPNENLYYQADFTIGEQLVNFGGGNLNEDFERYALKAQVQLSDLGIVYGVTEEHMSFCSPFGILELNTGDGGGFKPVS